MTQKTPTPDEKIKIYSDMLRLLRKIEKDVNDYQLYRESIVKSIDMDVPELDTSVRNGCTAPISICHFRIGEATEEKDREVSK